MGLEKMIPRVVIYVSSVSGSTLFRTTELETSGTLNIDLDNNCGARPVGPKYPSPAVNATGSPGSETECDIIKDSIYTHGYRCKASCLENSEKKVEIFCNCF